MKRRRAFVTGENLGRLDTAMAGDDASVGINQDRVRKPQRLERFDELSDPLLGMFTRTISPESERSDRAVFDLQ